MRAIRKGREPTSLTEHRLTPRCYYDNYAAKDDLRHALVTEQRGLCCYCMGRIRIEPFGMKVEHWRCQDDHPEEQLRYGNLLGACLGGEGKPRHVQHCDTHKGNRALLYNPAEPAHHIEERIHYEPDGTIASGDAAFDAQLSEVLNLNLPRLKNNRKAILTGILDWWKHEKGRIRGPVPKERVELERARRVAGNGNLEPFCQVVIWWLEQRLRRMP